MSSTKLIISLDPFAREPSAEALKTLNRFAVACGLNVAAVSVISPDRVSWPQDFDESWRESFGQVGELALRQSLEENRAPENWEPVVLTEPRSSAKTAVRALLSFAMDSQALMFAAIAFQKPNHWFGGFANRLLNESPLPVLIVKASAPAVSEFRKLLFATDFTDVDRPALDSAANLAQKLQAKLVLVHVLTAPPPEIIENSGLIGGMANLDRFLRKQEMSARTVAEQWMRSVPEGAIEWVLLYSTSGVADAILSTCKNQSCDAIVLRASSHSGGISLLGSTSRDVVHKATVPVLVMK